MLDLPALQALHAKCTDPVGGKFYRRFYGLTGSDTPHIESLADWQHLPLLTKDDLATVPLRERSFLPLTELDHLRTSSGTSGKEVVFSPRTHVRGMEYRLEYHDFTNPFLAFSVPLMPHWHERFLKENGKCPTVITYDPAQPAASARLAARAGVDAFSVFLYHVPALGEALKREGIAGNIRFIEVTGEICTRVQYEYMRATFPQARILQSYGASEVEDVHIGMPCKPLDGTEPLAVYHPKATHYLEIIDPDTGTVLEPKPGVEGDLLITAYPGEPSAFPLIRFRIGDTIRVVEESCAQHGAWSFTVVGRTDMDFMKVAGGIIRREEAERVIGLLAGRVTSEFEVHRFEEATDAGPKTRLEFHVEPIGNEHMEILARDIAENFRVNPARTYAEGVRDGMYLALTCAPFLPPPGAKKRRLITH
jgi:phenylacetate-coenzyme A ligase PaaK-like adenylate-forming protein